MKRPTIYFLLLIIIHSFSSQSALSQNRTIIGSAINVISGKPVSGIKIQVKGLNFFTNSDSLGEFSMIVPDTLKEIQFADFDGMMLIESKEISTGRIEIYLSEHDFNDLTLEELLNIKVTVSSTTAQDVFNTPSTITVIDKEMVKQYNFLSVAEILRTVAGMDIYQTNIDDNVPTARGILQNYYANKVLIMIDNVPTWQPIYGNTNLDRIDVNDIERIEVLRGPASVLYGSNAYVGVVNIVLQKAESDKVNVRIGAGYHRLGAAGANISMKKKDFSLFISGNNSFEIQKPYEVTGKRQDLYKGDTVYLYEGEIKSYNFNIVSSYRAFTFLLNTYEYQHSFLGINPSFISGGGKPVNDRGTLLSLKYDKNMKSKCNFRINIAYDYFKRDWPSNDNISNILELSGTRIYGSGLINYQAAHFMNIELGVVGEQRMAGGHKAMDALKDTVVHDNLTKADNINEISTFAQIDIKTVYLDFLGGVRYTNNSVVGNNISGRFTTAFHVSETSSIKLIFGQSFRAPTMLELYFNHPTVIGNQDLKPEKSSSIELAYLLGSKSFFTQLIGYYSKFDQLIQRYTPATGPPSQYQNLSSFDGYGIELEVRYQNPIVVNGFISYNYMNGEGQDADYNFRHVPHHTIRAGLHKSIGNFFISTNAYGVTSVIGNPKLMIEIPPQFMMDIHAGFKHVTNKKKIPISHTFSAKNITGSEMLVPEYIRQTDNINSQAATGFGRRFIYTVTFSF